MNAEARAWMEKQIALGDKYRDDVEKALAIAKATKTDFTSALKTLGWEEPTGPRACKVMEYKGELKITAPRAKASGGQPVTKPERGKVRYREWDATSVKPELREAAKDAVEECARERHLIQPPTVRWFDEEDILDVDTRERYERAGQAAPYVWFDDVENLLGATPQDGSNYIWVRSTAKEEDIPYICAHEVWHLADRLLNENTTWPHTEERAAAERAAERYASAYRDHLRDHMPWETWAR